MNKLSNFLSGTKILETTHSKYNGSIQVVRDFAWGTYIVANNLTQSGGILNTIWKPTLSKIKNEKLKITNCLILGLGGGSVAKIVNKNWPDAKITGVDIDEKMVQLGVMHLALDTSRVKIIIQDASDYCLATSDLFDLVLVDLYCGDKFPEKFEEDKFLKNIKKILKYGSAAGGTDGVVIFNRLFGEKDKDKSLKFG